MAAVYIPYELGGFHAYSPHSTTYTALINRGLFLLGIGAQLRYFLEQMDLWHSGLVLGF